MIGPAKVGVGLLGLIAVGASGIGIFRIISPSTIGEELLKENKKLVSENDEILDTLVKNYSFLESDKSSKPDTLKTIEGFSLKDKSGKEKEELYKKCQELLNTSLASQESSEITRKKQEAKDWCVIGGLGASVKIT